MMSNTDDKESKQVYVKLNRTPNLYFFRRYKIIIWNTDLQLWGDKTGSKTHVAAGKRLTLLINICFLYANKYATF